MDHSVNGASSVRNLSYPAPASFRAIIAIHSAITSSVISFGQTAALADIGAASKRFRVHLRHHPQRAQSRSGWPCGSNPRCAIFAPVNSAAEAFGHAATHAPQPMQAAASMARSASSFGTRIALPSGALPVGNGDISASRNDPVERAPIHHQILDHRKRLARATAPDTIPRRP